MTRIVESTVAPVHPPLTPSATNARNQLLHELAKAKYASAHPNPFNQWIQSIENWLASLFNHVGGSQTPANGSVFIGVLVFLIVAAIVVAFFVFGLPRINRRSRKSMVLFGDEDDRDSSALRAAAERAANSGDFSTAIQEGFRSIARGLAERVLLTTFPGTTAHTFSTDAGRVFPDFAPELAAAANSFDATRYLGRQGTLDEWLRIRALEANLRTARPLIEAVPA